MVERVRAAHGDAWQVLGALRESVGGGTVTLPGVRLMASGLQHPQWNNGDVDEPSAVDIAAVTAWYAERDVPWGLRVPAGAVWRHGRLLLHKRLMGLEPSAFGPESMDGLDVRVAGPGDLHDVLAVDSVAFDSDVETQRPWMEPHLAAEQVETALATLSGRAVGTAYCVRSNGRAGPAAYLAGVGVMPEARGKGVGGAMSSWLIARALAAGVQLVHLDPDDDHAAALYARLGFVEVPGLDVYVDVA